MAAAWLYAEGDGPMPEELRNLTYINRFGAPSVFGRTLGYGEIQRMCAAENIVTWHRERASAGDWVKWANDNPAKSAALNRAMKAANDGTD